MLNMMKENGDPFRIVCYAGDNVDRTAFYLIEIPDTTPDPCGDDCRECGCDCPHAEPAKIEALQLALEKAESRVRAAEAESAMRLSAVQELRKQLSDVVSELEHAESRACKAEAEVSVRLRNIQQLWKQRGDLNLRIYELRRDLSAADDRITELQDAGRENEEWRKLGERMKKYLKGSLSYSTKSIYDDICDLIEFHAPAESD
jgi:chromosome segregation ATPase